MLPTTYISVKQQIILTLVAFVSAVVRLSTDLHLKSSNNKNYKVYIEILELKSHFTIFSAYKELKFVCIRPVIQTFSLLNLYRANNYLNLSVRQASR
jgi:hypothetical protein